MRDTLNLNSNLASISACYINIISTELILLKKKKEKLKPGNTVLPETLISATRFLLRTVYL